MKQANASMTLIVLIVRLVLTSTVRIHAVSLMIHVEQMLIVKPLFTEQFVRQRTTEKLVNVLPH
jgi:hypothetical protein